MIYIYVSLLIVIQTCSRTVFVQSFRGGYLSNFNFMSMTVDSDNSHVDKFFDINSMRNKMVQRRSDFIVNVYKGLAIAPVIMYPNVKSSQASTIDAIDTVGLRQQQQRKKNIVTSYAYIDIKIANYTEESIGANKGALGSGRVVFGLYGNDAPASAALFLSTALSDGVEKPNYTNTQFNKLLNGLLEIEHIRGINTMNIAGNEQYEYQGNLLVDYYKPILERNDIKHDSAGLLTRSSLSGTPEFGITTSACPDLDTFHVVFGEITSGYDVIDAISKVPTYSYKTSTGYGGKVKGPEAKVADKWFEAQKAFYVKVGQTLGDQRAVDQRGKLLRRVVITGSGVLQQ